MFLMSLSKIEIQILGENEMKIQRMLILCKYENFNWVWIILQIVTVRVVDFDVLWNEKMKSFMSHLTRQTKTIQFTANWFYWIEENLIVTYINRFF